MHPVQLVLQAKFPKFIYLLLFFHRYKFFLKTKLKVIFLPMHVPSLVHAVDLQAHVNCGSLKAESEPMHPVQTVALVHVVQLLLQANFKIIENDSINIFNKL